MYSCLSLMLWTGSGILAASMYYNEIFSRPCPINHRVGTDYSERRASRIRFSPLFLLLSSLSLSLTLSFSLPLSPPPPPSLSLLLSLLLISLRVGRVIRSSRLGKRCWRPHLQSGRAQGSSRVWMAQGTGSGWGSQTGCRWRTRTAGSLRRSSCYCAWEEQHQHEEEQERSVWTASSRYCVSYWEDGAEDSVTLTPPPTDPDSSDRKSVV